MEWNKFMFHCLVLLQMMGWKRIGGDSFHPILLLTITLVPSPYGVYGMKSEPVLSLVFFNQSVNDSLNQTGKARTNTHNVNPAQEAN